MWTHVAILQHSSFLIFSAGQNLCHFLYFENLNPKIDVVSDVKIPTSPDVLSKKTQP